MKTNKVINNSIYWILFLGLLLTGSASQAANGPMLYDSQNSQLHEVRQGVQQGSLASKRIQNDLFGEWFYEPIPAQADLIHTNMGYALKSIKVESGGSVTVVYKLDASKETLAKTGRLEFIHKGADDAFSGKRPAFLIQFKEGGNEEFMVFTNVTVNYDSRVLKQRGKVLNYRDMEGREFILFRKQ